MATTFEEVVKLAQQLNAEQQNLLIYRLRIQQMQERQSQETPKSIESIAFSDRWAFRRGIEYIESYRSPTREELIQEAEALRQTQPKASNSLLGKYANPNLLEMSEEEFHAQMHSIATEWEQELDEFTSDES